MFNKSGYRFKKIPVFVLILVFVSLILPGNLFAQSDLDAAKSLQNAFRWVSKRVLPVVVEINVVDFVENNKGNAFRFFDKNDSSPHKQQGLGSGVIVERRENFVYILTNYHVVKAADEISVKLYDGRVFNVTIVGGDPLKDLALLKFETKEAVPIARLGNSDLMQVGDWVLAIGNPLGFDSTVTAGIVSAVGRNKSPSYQSLTDYIQTDAAINPGNSGGALVNLDGEVIGINTWIASRNGGSVGLGFSIPINNARSAIDDLISEGVVQYGWLGVNMGDLTPGIKEEMNLRANEGAFVFNVYCDSPAMKGRVKPGDLIVAVNDTSVKNSNDLTKAITGIKPEEKVVFTLIRNGQQRKEQVVLGLRDIETKETSQALWPGITLIPISDEIRKQLKISADSGNLVVANVADPGTGLQNGDVIRTVNKDSVKTLRDFYKAVNRTDNLTVRVVRRGYNVEVKISK